MKHFPRWCPALFGVFLLAVNHLAWAARPMNTDDANVVDPRSCQVESWVRSAYSTNERWAIPGCNFFGDTEVSVGTNFLAARGQGTQQLGLVQVKKRWQLVEPGQWGLSTTLGRVQSPHADKGASPNLDTYVNIPATWATEQGPILHLNLGAYHHQAERVTQTTWGVGGEIPLNRRLFTIMESYGETGSRSKFQLGLRFWIVPQAVQIDTTYGQDVQGDSHTRWFSVGLRLLSPALY